jgi:hypothetical protein
MNVTLSNGLKNTFDAPGYNTLHRIEQEAETRKFPPLSKPLRNGSDKTVSTGSPAFLFSSRVTSERTAFYPSRHPSNPLRHWKGDEGDEGDEYLITFPQRKPPFGSAMGKAYIFFYSFKRVVTLVTASPDQYPSGFTG